MYGTFPCVGQLTIISRKVTFINFLKPVRAKKMVFFLVKSILLKPFSKSEKQVKGESIPLRPVGEYLKHRKAENVKSVLPSHAEKCLKHRKAKITRIMAKSVLPRHSEKYLKQKRKHLKNVWECLSLPFISE